MYHLYLTRLIKQPVKVNRNISHSLQPQFQPLPFDPRFRFLEIRTKRIEPNMLRLSRGVLGNDQTRVYEINAQGPTLFRYFSF